MEVNVEEAVCNAADQTVLWSYEYKGHNRYRAYAAMC